MDFGEDVKAAARRTQPVNGLYTPNALSRGVRGLARPGGLSLRRRPDLRERLAIVADGL